MADQPTLVQRLRACNVHRFGAAEKWPEPRNPDGPEAADRIEALEAEVERHRNFVRAVHDGLTWNSSQTQCLARIELLVKRERAALEGEGS